MARCLLIEAKLPKQLWTYAIMAAAYIRNRCYLQRTKQTPYFLLTGKRPNVINMHIFGTICYPYQIEKRKLDNRCKKGIFLGYDKGSPAYIVYYPESNSILTHRCVTFTDSFVDPVIQRDAAIFDEDNFPDVNVQREAVDVDEVNEPDVIVEEVVEPVVEDVDAGAVGGNENNVQPPRRYPDRIRKPPDHLHDYVVDDDSADVTHDYGGDEFYVDFCCKANVLIPKTYKEAVTSAEADRWKEAMDDEINSLHENNTYEIVQLPRDKQPVGGRWVYTVKVDPGGKERYKARYVARVFSQKQGSDYFETFSPTAKMTTVRMLMQIAVEFDLIVHQMDVITAYLNAPLDCEIYMNQPKGYEQFQDNKCKMVCKLLKSLYGLKQSGRMWNLMLHNFLKKKGFTQSPHDPCTYVFNDNPDIAIVLIWVDDIVVAANSNDCLVKVKNYLKTKFCMKDLGPISCFLGIRFKQEEGVISMDQAQYLKSKLVKFGMDMCKPRSTPCELAGYDIESDERNENSSLYREMVGSLIYAMTCTRPDLSWVVSKLSQHLSNPSDVDLVMLKHVFRYILGTLDYCLSFRKSSDGLKLNGVSDADWGTSSDRKSTSGYFFSLNKDGPAVSWKTKKQQTVALSSCESEYMALCAATQEAIYLSRLLNDLNIVKKPVEPVVVNVDNQGAIALAKNPVHHNRSKHIDIKYHFIRESVVNKKIELVYVPSSNNIADLMTKPASKVKLTKFHKLLFGY